MVEGVRSLVLTWVGVVTGGRLEMVDGEDT